MSHPIRTTSGKQIVEALDAQVTNAEAKLADLRAINLDEATTWTRQGVRGAIARLEAGIESMLIAAATVRQLLPYVEVDAVQRAMPGVSLGEAEFLLGDPEPEPPDDPADPTLPWVGMSVTKRVGAHL